MIHRLDPEKTGHWSLFEQFQGRVRLFMQKYLPQTPENIVLAFIRQRWVASAVTTGYWLGLKENGDSYGHLCSWVDEAWGQTYINFWQIEIDNEGGLEAIAQVGKEVREWCEKFNGILQAQGRRPIAYGESYTWIDPKVYERLFRHAGINIQAYRTVYRWELGPQEAVYGRREAN